jgi:hypothetical protein
MYLVAEKSDGRSGQFIALCAAFGGDFLFSLCGGIKGKRVCGGGGCTRTDVETILYSFCCISREILIYHFPVSFLFLFLSFFFFFFVLA